MTREEFEALKPYDTVYKPRVEAPHYAAGVVNGVSDGLVSVRMLDGEGNAIGDRYTFFATATEAIRETIRLKRFIDAVDMEMMEDALAKAERSS